jgi:hypothetical protein
MKQNLTLYPGWFSGQIPPSFAMARPRAGVDASSASNPATESPGEMMLIMA